MGLIYYELNPRILYTAACCFASKGYFLPLPSDGTVENSIFHVKNPRKIEKEKFSFSSRLILHKQKQRRRIILTYENEGIKSDRYPRSIN